MSARPNLFDRLIFNYVNRRIARRHLALVEQYIKVVGEPPNVAMPRSNPEMTQWRKVFDRNPLFTVLLDKLKSKDWVKERCPDLAIPETVWVGRDPEKIPDRFFAPGYVIKTNHATSQNIFPERETRTRKQLNTKIKRWLAEPFQRGEQWGYYRIPRRVFVERLVPSDGPMMDICIRAFDGRAELVSIATDFKTDRQRYAYFELDGRRTGAFDPNNSMSLLPEVEAPEILADAVRYAEVLSRGLDYVRVDFLYGGSELFFSEMTIYPNSGMGKESADTRRVYLSWLHTVEKSWFFTTPQNWRMRPYVWAARRWFRAQRRATAAEFQQTRVRQAAK